jgi:hypothetical protein
MNAVPTPMHAEERKFRCLNTLVPGIPISVLSADIDKPDRLRINSGSKRISDPEYTELSFVPQEDWRPMTATETEVAQDASVSRLDSERISIWRVPTEVSTHFELFRRSIAKYNDLKLLENLWTHIEYQRGRSKLYRMVRDAGLGESLKILGHYCRGPGSVVSSVNREGLFVGLHIDSWANPTISTRTTGFPSRLCVNLGPETRYLNVLNLSVRQMSAMSLGPVTEDPVEFTVEFLRDNPRYPLIQISIEPGEAYIAPTEIMIHDATTLGKKYVDASTTFLGDFTLSSISSLPKLR